MSAWVACRGRLAGVRKAESENLLNRGYYIVRGNLFNRIIWHPKELDKLRPEDLKKPGWNEKGRA
jgi:hypothetical protein